eukprot:TRINITY_DN868_c0_g3_i3.p1 TRINITY_DN868_c0_g3~~TRINITY_DN868_c0_g3_i3.p1  ORF type:complete len:661 (+),score=165.39 TRINITY_DN868_c0_g3_i3:806-2788(+)
MTTEPAASELSMAVPQSAKKVPVSRDASIDFNRIAQAVSPFRGAFLPQRPLNKLSVNLVATYSSINRKYFEAKRTQVAQPSDSQTEYTPAKGDLLNQRYEIIQTLGSGSFGCVVDALDRHTQERVALKIVKNRQGFFEQAQEEIELLKYLNSRDLENRFGVVRLLDHFVERGHQCLVFELLSMNLYEIVRNTNFEGISLNLIRKFSKQLLLTLDFLASVQPYGVIHCDLKPENILLCSNRRATIKIIDFGSSCFTNGKMYSYIQSRFYRAPEVILGLPYSFPIDIWSLGCLLAELHVGRPLFNGRTEAEQVAKHTAVLGCPPAHMIENSKRGNRYFIRTEQGYKLDEQACPKQDLPPLHVSLGVFSGGPGGRRTNEKSGHSREDYLAFYDLIRRMLDLNPSTRITAVEALRHPFFDVDGNRAMLQSLSIQPVSQISVCAAPAVPRPQRLINLTAVLNRNLKGLATGKDSCASALATCVAGAACEDVSMKEVPAPVAIMMAPLMVAAARAVATEESKMETDHSAAAASASVSCPTSCTASSSPSSSVSSSSSSSTSSSSSSFPSFPAFPALSSTASQSESDSASTSSSSDAPHPTSREQMYALLGQRRHNHTSYSSKTGRFPLYPRLFQPCRVRANRSHRRWAQASQGRGPTHVRRKLVHR